MALSNIFREPRREITEIMIGLTLVGGALIADYFFATWFERLCGMNHWPSGDEPAIPWPLGMIIGVGVGFVAFGGLLITHKIGEDVCNALERNGLNLRPRR